MRILFRNMRRHGGRRDDGFYLGPWLWVLLWFTVVTLVGGFLSGCAGDLSLYDQARKGAWRSCMAQHVITESNFGGIAAQCQHIVKVTYPL